MEYIRLIAFLFLLSSVGPSYGVLVGSVADGAAFSVIAGVATKKKQEETKKAGSPSGATYRRGAAALRLLLP
ncbi:hypothetical protein [Bacteroides heparinolyticus]|uniref:hypothetical protein n=1 Tax=Prevotella heparinolytica TaxID=28113 RepID=UPI00359F96DC